MRLKPPKTPEEKARRFLLDYLIHKAKSFSKGVVLFLLPLGLALCIVAPGSIESIRALLMLANGTMAGLWLAAFCVYNLEPKEDED